jgi:WhiB family redox-sensing transcriptional regulator
VFDDPVDAIAREYFAGALDWMRDGACLEHLDDADAWFPPRGANPNAAKRICSACLVKTECLAFALRLGIDDGVWGGTSPGERRRLAT